MEAGTRVVEVIWPKVANSDNHSWDHHKDLPKRLKIQSAPMLDGGLASLLADLDDRGLLQSITTKLETTFVHRRGESVLEGGGHLFQGNSILRPLRVIPR